MEYYYAMILVRLEIIISLIIGINFFGKNLRMIIS
jgi:hypothetical protein